MCPALAHVQSRDAEHGPLNNPFPVALAVTLQVILQTLQFAFHQYRLSNTRIMSTTNAILM